MLCSVDVSDLISPPMQRAWMEFVVRQRSGCILATSEALRGSSRCSCPDLESKASYKQGKSLQVRNR